MTERTPTRRDLMKPVQLIGLSLVAAVFAGLVTVMSMGAFQSAPAEDVQRAIIVGLIVAGSVFIATLVIIALLILAIDPAKVAQPVDRPVLLPEEEDDAPDAGAAGPRS